MAIIFTKGCANGQCGWVNDPMRKIFMELERGDNNSNYIVTKLNIYDVLSLRDSSKTYKQTKMVKYFPFPALIHVHLRDLPISEIYAEEYCKNIISCFKECFNHIIGYGGNLVDKTGEHFHAVDSMFLTIDAAKLCCRLYEKDIENGVLDEHPDVVT